MSDDPFNYLIAEDWSKPFAARVRNATTDYIRWKESYLATIEAVVRRLVRRGWIRRRTSIGRINHRAASRYLLPKDDRRYVIRISNHYITPEKKIWLKDYVITDEIIRGYNVLGIITWIERDYRNYLRNPDLFKNRLVA
jgi:hypothetical protein